MARKEGRNAEGIKERESEKWYTYAGCRLWHWSPCHWELLCWRPCRWSADLFRWWKVIGRACSQCFLFCHPGAKSAKSEEGLSRVQCNSAGSFVDKMFSVSKSVVTTVGWSDELPSWNPGFSFSWLINKISSCKSFFNDKLHCCPPINWKGINEIHRWVASSID